MTAADVIRGALERLGPNGERWCSDGAENEAKHQCVGLAIFAAVPENEPFARGDHPLALVCEEAGVSSTSNGDLYEIGKWQDDPRIGWEDVHLVLKRALHRAECEGL